MDNATLQRLQEVEFEILCQVDAFCAQHQIRYSLFCGTLLGAVRHGGFIPWDDDIDLAMTRSEYTKFRECWRRAPLPGYYFQNFETDEHCVISHGKVRKENTLLFTSSENPNEPHQGIWIDIFPLDKFGGGSLLERKTLLKAYELIALTRANGDIPIDGISKRLFRRMVSLIPREARRREMMNILRWFQCHDDALRSDFVWKSMSAGWHIKRWTFPMTMPDSFDSVPFHGRSFPAYQSYRELLCSLYGDYMRLPPPEERVCKHNPLKIEF